jgi:ADP-heptose:LPS heptosyltransferase
MSNPKQRILVVRFSALGDVVMTVPVVKAFLSAHPETEIIMLSDKKMADLFTGIERLIFVGADLKGKNKGLLGIYRLYQQLKKAYQFEKVADLHGVIRSHLLRLLFRINKKTTAVIDKGRFEKFALVRKENKIYRPLKHSTERYVDVFRMLGFKGLGKQSFTQETIRFDRSNKNIEKGARIKIGFAPFAKHVPKMYPLDQFIEVMRYFDNDQYELYFFGGGPVEMAFIKEWENTFRHAVAFNHQLGLKDELALMSKMQVMVTMDSANMHLASLVNVPVVSVWGPTHPHAGFYGLGQDPLNAVQVSLACRPCSVFGNKKCWRGDHACMQEITPQAIIEKIKNLIS